MKNSRTMYMIETILNALYFFVPAYVANTFACILGKGRPVDLGTNFIDGRRILGDGVTIRGSLSGIACGVIVGVILQMNLLLVFLLSFGAIAGDAAGSFIKRRANMERGSPAPILDQLNFVAGGLLLAGLVTSTPVNWIVVIIVFTPLGHLFVNMTGYLLKFKDVPW